jgi:hypothetical protein
MQNYVHSQNLTRYVDLLETETDSAKLGQIQKLLIEEEDRFGSLAQRLDEAERLIRDGEERIRRQQALTQRLGEDGHDRARAEALLATMARTLQMMLEYRRKLADGLDGIDL